MPGIHLYTSNRLEILADTFAELIQSEPLPVLQKETVLIQSRGMARWLALETATRLDIWANCDCPFPNTFTREIFRLFLPDMPSKYLYDKEYVLWHLMAILPGLTQDPHFGDVASYLEPGDHMKLYQLSYEIADLFDQYTLFRPEMILEWEDNTKKVPPEQAWQSILWRRLLERLAQGQQFPEFHRARLLQLFEEKIISPSFEQAILPPRISIFGISSLPPYHLRILAALSHHIDLHFFIMNPCKEYWFDIIADRDIVKISRKEEASQDTLHLRQGNSLLASMGHLGRDFLAMLQNIYSEDHELSMDPGDDSLLSSIQQDILYLREYPEKTHGSQNNKKTITNTAESLVFHSCHSPMREVEILKDQLLDIFDNADASDPIEPRDILVMAPDIDEYSPLIRAVFDTETSSLKKIPYSISDQSIRQTSKYLETFLHILQLPQTRFSSVDLAGILETEAVKTRFSINDNDLDTLENWIRETRICWGIDQDHKTKLQLPAYRENTWKSGLDRLMLGYAMAGHGQVLFKNILPHDPIEGNDTKLLGNFLDFTETIFDLGITFQKNHTLAEWSEILLQTKDRLLLADENSEIEDRILHRLLYQLQELQTRTSFNNEVPIGVIRSFLIRSLDNQFSPITSGTGFLAGGVTFCSMLPMRAIPFKVICLLGLNDGIYPRSGSKKSFDLMAMAPRRGDRSKRYDDRYLFLETILSARKKLSISFVGQSIRDGSKRAPSVLVSELMDYIDQSYKLPGDQADPETALSDELTTIHHLQPFHPDYFIQPKGTGREKFFSYSAENCEAAIALSSGQQTIIPAFSEPLPTPPFESKCLELHELVRFFYHPARYILVKTVGIAPIEDSLSLETSEPFTLKGLTKYKLQNDILECLLNNRDCAKLYQTKKAAGELPHGSVGENHFMQMVSELRPFHKNLADLLCGNEFKQQQFNLKIGDYTLTGNLDHISGIGLLQYRYSSMKPKDFIRSWISHLVLNSIQDCTAAECGNNTFYAAKEGIYKYRPVAESRQYLEQLLELYWLGLTTPLCFFPGPSFVFAQDIHKGKNEQEALSKALAEWEGNDFNKKGEKNDPYNLLCFRNMDLTNTDFIEQAKKVFLPALAHREKYR